jgi:hypothetical protein
VLQNPALVTLGSSLAFIAVEVCNLSLSRFAKFISIAIVTLLALSGCSGSYEQYVLRYRLTLTLVVDGKELTGSVVQALRYSRSPTVLPDERPTQIRVMGQALTLELPNRDEVMLLLFSNRGYEDDIMGCIYGAFGQTSSMALHQFEFASARFL